LEEQSENKKQVPQDDGESEVRVIDGGQAFLELLKAQNVDYIFFNPGSDFYPILEHLSETRERQQRPKQIMCLTEHLALSMAHGYSMATGKAQVVIVHAGLGTLALGGALHNVFRGREPVLIVAGRSPYTFEGELPGGRDRPYHWDQELFDQLGIARQFVKWTYELKTNTNLHHVVARAIQVANTEPKGPVYLILPRELLAEKQESVKILPPRWSNSPEPPQASEEGLQAIAENILNADSPVILTQYLGRNVSAVHSLVELAELLGAPVIEPSRKRTNFPTNHELYLPGFPKNSLEEADAILLLDIDVPWSPSIHKIGENAKILQIDLDPLKSGIPLWGFPVDVSVSASCAVALPQLVKILRNKTGSIRGFEDRAKARKEKITKESKRIRLSLSETARVLSGKSPMKPECVLNALNEFKKQDSIVVCEGSSNETLVYTYVDSTEPGTFFALGGSSLGDGPGNALGLKIAHPERDVFCIVGDGGFVYSNPTSVYWTASKYGIPTLTVLLDNHGYKAMKGAVDRGYPEGFSKKNDSYSGARIDPSPDYLMSAKASGAVAWRATSLNELRQALYLAIEKTRSGIPALIDAKVEPA
jgi:acetolactate synthase I/II/III large subunit